MEFPDWGKACRGLLPVLPEAYLHGETGAAFRDPKGDLTYERYRVGDKTFRLDRLGFRYGNCPIHYRYVT